MSPIAASFAAPFRHTSLIWQFVRREILGRYRGSILGLGWSIVTPLLMLMVYTFVFVGIFKARWPGAESGGGIGFALQLFAGLAVFNFFAEVLGRAPSLIVEQPNLVKKVVFPLEILPFVTIGAALFHLALSLLILLGGTLLIYGRLAPAALALPLVLLPLLPLLLGLCWLFAALGVFLRDIAQIMGMAINLLLFLSPIFYSVSTIPDKARFWIYLNPLTPVIENVRLVLFIGDWPDWSSWLVYLACASVVAIAGAAFFQGTRKGFADVL